MTIALQTPSLTLNGLNLMMGKTASAHGYLINALGDGARSGDPEAVIASIQSQLQDGDLERIDRYGNREATIPLVIEAPESAIPGDVLAQAEAAIVGACQFDGWAELVWESPLAAAETTIFEVTSATVSVELNDMDEMEAGCRYVTLSIHARPFVRGAKPLTVAAPSVATATVTNVDNGSSTAGWALISAAPPVFHNLIPNPSLETNATGWSADGTSVGSRQTAALLAAPPNGSAYYKVVSTNSIPPIGRAPAAYYATAVSPVAVVTPNKVVGVWFSVLAGAGCSGTGQVTVTYYSDTSARTIIGNDSRTFTINKTAWKTTGFFSVVPAGAVRAQMVISGKWDGGATTTMYVDAVALRDDSTLAYLDGATPDTAAITYAWTGAANNSITSGTWTAPTLGVVSSQVKGIVFGQSAAAIRRTAPVVMTVLPYMVIKGTATVGRTIEVQVADHGSDPIAPDSYTYNSVTGAFTVIIKRPSGFTSVDVSTVDTTDTVSRTSGLFIAVGNIDITDNPYSVGKVQSRQVPIYGSERAELSLSVLGLDPAGTTPVPLGEQVLIYTAAGGDSATFLDSRNAAGLGGTADGTAVSGAYNTPGTTAAPTALAFPVASLAAGTYMAIARVRTATVVAADLISFRAHVDPSGGVAISDPRTGWKTAPLTAVAADAVWPQVNTGSWVLLPLGLLRLPPGDVEGTAATITIEIAKGTVAIDVDDIFLTNVDEGQLTLMITDPARHSAVRLDAATVDTAQPSAWVGVAGGVMAADAGRWMGEQHQAKPGLLQIATVTPGCATSRVSAVYYPRFHSNVATVSV